MKKWEDLKSFRSGEKLIESSIQFGAFKLHVHRHIDYPPSQWLATSHGIFDKRELKSKNIEEAKTQAKAILQTILQDALDEMIKS